MRRKAKEALRPAACNGCRTRARRTKINKDPKPIRMDKTSKDRMAANSDEVQSEPSTAAPDDPVDNSTKAVKSRTKSSEKLNNKTKPAIRS